MQGPMMAYSLKQRCPATAGQCPTQGHTTKCSLSVVEEPVVDLKNKNSVKEQE